MASSNSHPTSKDDALKNNSLTLCIQPKMKMFSTNQDNVKIFSFLDQQDQRMPFLVDFLLRD